MVFIVSRSQLRSPPLHCPFIPQLLLGLALNVELIDPDDARAAASSDLGPVADTRAKLASSVPAAANFPAASKDAPAILIHAMRTGGRAVTCSSALAEPAHEPSEGHVSVISAHFKSTRALPTIYYQENARSLAKRTRVDDAADPRLPR